MEENNQNSNATSTVSPVAQTPPIQTPPASKPKSKFPILIIGIILLLLIAGSAAGFYVFKPHIMKPIPKPTRTPTIIQTPIPTTSVNPTANWKTFSNSQNGYQISYPDTWGQSYLGIVTQKDPNAVSLYYTKEFSSPSELPMYYGKEQSIYYVYISVFPNQNNLNSFATSKAHGAYGNLSKTTFKGLPAMKGFGQAGEHNRGSVPIYFIHDNKGFEIIYLLTDSNLDGNSAIVPDILSTFKFTN